jgi:hypothetical protein
VLEEAQKKAEAEGEKKRIEEFTKLKEGCEKELGCTLTENDLRDLLYKGALVKQITIFPKLMDAEFRVLSTKEFSAVDQAVAQIELEGKHTREGVGDEKAKLLLSYGWLTAGGRPLGGTAEERLKTINEMPTLSVVEASKKWNVFDLLVRLSLGEGSYLKK